MPPERQPIHKSLAWPQDTGLTNAQMLCLGRCGTPQQFWNMVSAFQAGTTPFGDRTRFDGTIVKELQYWFIFEPPGTYNRHEGTLQARWVVAYRQQDGYDAPSELDHIPPEAWAEMSEVGHFLRKQYPGGALYMRTGDPFYNGCTVPHHLHWVYDVPNGLGKVRPAIYKDEAGWKKDHARFLAYWRVFKQVTTLEEFLEIWESG